MDHLKRAGSGLFNFHGRSPRTELLVLVVTVQLGVMAVRLTGVSSSFAAYVEIIASLIFITPIAVRRLHDHNRSGWFALGIPVLLSLRAWAQWQFDIGRLEAPNVDYPYNLALLALVVALWGLMLWPGTNGTNRYSPDPRTEDATLGTGSPPARG